MKKEGNKIYLIIVILLVLVVIGLLIYSLKLRNEMSDYKDSQNDTVNNDYEQNDNTIDEEEEITYDCSFTRTYNMVNTLDGYVAEVPELSYVVVDAYQSHDAYTHVVPSNLKDNLKNGVTYEFTYTLKGTGIVNDMEDIYDLIVWTTFYTKDPKLTTNPPDVSVTLSIEETDKLGMAQKQEPICGAN